jgi:hypothetical protein
MDTILLALAITGIISAGLGIVAGMSLQWRRSEAYIKRLENMREDAYDEMVEQEWCCHRMAYYQKRIKELTASDGDWGEDTFDMDELQMRQSGAHQ